MKISAIDIGSNSVRLAMFSDGKTLYKRLATTRLGEGLNASGLITPEAIERTALAVADFARTSKTDCADKIYAFATAAVRSAENRADFLKRVKELCGIDVDVVDGKTEAKLGLMGALKGADGGIIDVGGASTEVSVRRGGETVCSKSINIGTVRLSDIAGRDKDKLSEAIGAKISEFGEFCARHDKLYAIGGTATRLAAIKHGLKEYRPEITDGTVLTTDELDAYTDMLLTMPVEQIRATTICSKSADIVGGGCLLLVSVMRKLGAERVTVSESDNLEGYVMYREGGL